MKLINSVVVTAGVHAEAAQKLMKNVLANGGGPTCSGGSIRLAIMAWSLPANPTIVEKTPLRPEPEMSALFATGGAAGSVHVMHRAPAGQPLNPPLDTVTLPAMLK